MLSPEKAIDIAKTIYKITAKNNENIIEHILLLTDEQKMLNQFINFG
jgi:hypothetical protein